MSRWQGRISGLAVALTAGLITPAAGAQADAAVAVAAAPVISTSQWEACLARLRTDVVSAGIPAATFDRHTGSLAPDTSVLQALDRQPEFVTPIWDYLAGLVDAERIADGRAMLERWDRELRAIEARFGVEREVIVAVWGVESDYGRVMGRRAVVRSLATLSCAGRRQAFFRGQFIASLKILEAGHVDPERLVGSWAGAFGQTQFMPGTFLETAVDFDGDGRRDIVDTVADALASTAHFLKRAGWRTGQPWGHEVRLPARFDASLAGRTQRRPLGQWANRGVQRVDGQAMGDPLERSAMLLPAGPKGPAFVVLRNFDALFAYNASENYALAIGLLANQLKSEPGVVTSWPTDDPGLSRAERRQLQEQLLERGHLIGEADGVIGTLSRAAILIEQQRLDLPTDGRAGRRLLKLLKDESARK